MIMDSITYDAYTWEQYMCPNCNYKIEIGYDATEIENNS